VRAVSDEQPFASQVDPDARCARWSVARANAFIVSSAMVISSLEWMVVMKLIVSVVRGAPLVASYS
jgi:hypothetical protein